MREQAAKRPPYPNRRLPWLIGLILLFLLCLALLFILDLLPIQPRFPPEEYFVQDQVILSGTSDQVDAALDTLPPGIELSILSRLAVQDLGPQAAACIAPEEIGPGYVIDLYEIQGPAGAVDDVINAIQQGGSGAEAEANWVVGHPWEAEGSPWEAEGSPWEAEGSPLSGNKSHNPAGPQAYAQQWAFETIELNAVDPRPTGANVRVGVFDTSPFSLPTAEVQAVQRTVNIVPAPLSLEVRHPQPLAVLPPSKSPWVDVRNHGLFAAGLIDAVAPDSQVELIRVLGSDNRGDLFTLNAAVTEFISTTLPVQADLDGIVMNMSLGVRIGPEEAEFGLPRTIFTLQNLLQGARCLGYVVVAAAGNNSAGLAPPSVGNIPSERPGVIGVAASSQSNTRACFSNAGDIAAPGGDGQNAQGTLDGCVPRNGTCQDGSCEFAVVGPILRPPAGTAQAGPELASQTTLEADYIYWTGTSFAAPLVTGLASVVLDAGDGAYSPAEVESILACGARRTAQPYLGYGVINVRETLQNCLDTDQIGSDPDPAVQR